jgi:hypothetical protein
MATPRTPAPALLVVAVFSRHDEARAWTRERLEEAHGPVALASEPFAFHHTTYYERTMGPDLRKQLLAFRDLVDEGCLAEVKLRANALEGALAAQGTFPERRPVNIDPGLLTLGKFVLATTKDQAHRIYLGQGIYAEVTLRFHDGAFEPWPWTYADYREPSVRAFLRGARDYYRRRLGEAAGA